MLSYINLKEFEKRKYSLAYIVLISVIFYKGRYKLLKFTVSILNELNFSNNITNIKEINRMTG